MSCSSKRNIEVGSCISTLVSSTKRRRAALSAPAGCRSERLRRFKYFLHVSVDLHLAPFAAQDACGVEQEGAAFDTHVFASIQGFFLDHIKLPADLLSGIGQQRVGQLFLQAELLVR